MIIIAALILHPCALVGQGDPCLVLGTTSWNNGQVRFSFTAEPAVDYFIESSGDLQNWVRVLTNRDLAFTRTITVNAPGAGGFYRASRGRLPLFGAGIIVAQNIVLNGNNIYADAYDSSDVVHFPAGLYNPTNAFAGGDVVAGSGGLASVANAVIHGRLVLQQGASFSIGPNGLIGDMPAYWPAQRGIEIPADQWVITNLGDNCYNQMFGSPDVVAPYTSGVSPTLGTGTNQYIFSGGNYYVAGDMQINNNKALIVASGVNALYVTGNFNALQNSLIVIEPGSLLRLYIGQASGSPVSASFGQVNNTGNALNFQVFGLPTCASVALGGNGPYLGTFYMPQAAFTFNQSGTNILDLQGAIAINSANLSNHVNFHFDQNLKRVGPMR